jgi:hypothetical protein
MTVPRLVTLLRSLGIFISKRQVVRLLNAGKDEFLTEARDVLRAGLSTADWITVDDTGARHKAANGFCTQIGNEHFTWFGTTDSKSRLNFLELLRAGQGDYVINDEAILSAVSVVSYSPRASFQSTWPRPWWRRYNPDISVHGAPCPGRMSNACCRQSIPPQVLDSATTRSCC